MVSYKYAIAFIISAVRYVPVHAALYVRFVRSIQMTGGAVGGHCRLGARFVRTLEKRAN